MKNRDSDATADVLYRIKRGLAGYVSYLAACEMNAAFSEYILYEPTLRILTARGFSTQSEVECPGYQRNGRGDVKRLDFVARKNGNHFALEMKWLRNTRPRIDRDLEKLSRYAEANRGALGFLCAFGRKSMLSEWLPPNGVRERGNGVYAEFGKTKFGCRTYQIFTN
ncbi:MAG TPA: hypothetical protein VM571_09805 [Noviherbaspirillum sp.]|jgi:hypothetical protein|nr:hypothetical protein [Noviherbaspirillum sp.]